MSISAHLQPFCAQVKHYTEALMIIAALEVPYCFKAVFCLKFWGCVVPSEKDNIKQGKAGKVRLNRAT